MVFTTEGFLEVAIESWLEWDLTPRPVTYIYMYIMELQQTIILPRNEKLMLKNT